MLGWGGVNSATRHGTSAASSAGPRPPGPSESFVAVRHHTDIVGPHPLKEALDFRLVEYIIPQPSNLCHLLLVRIDEVELVKQQLLSLVLTFGRI